MAKFKLAEQAKLYINIWLIKFIWKKQEQNSIIV